MPMLCLASGFALFHFGRVPLEVSQGAMIIVAEITLAIVLFVEASRLTSSTFEDNGLWPTRMLSIGLPLAIILGTGIVLLLLPQFGIWEAALIAALLAPTDAALGRSVFSSSAVPRRLRETLTVESGLNDGLALPAIIFLACAAVGFDHTLNQGSWLWFAFKQVAFGVLLGAAVGAAGGRLSHISVERGWAQEDNTEIFGLLIVGIAYLSADLAGGNGFVSVFVCGILFGPQAKDCARRTREFLDTDGQLLMMVTFFYIGAIMLPAGLPHVDWRVASLVLLSLFVVRPLAIAISLIRAGVTAREVVFLGWFGPRGLATALFTLILLDEFVGELPLQTLQATAGLAVALSAILHGTSAHYASKSWDTTNAGGD